MMKLKEYLYCILLAGFLIGIHNGRIAIWQGEDPQPKAILPYSAELLPEADRIALQNGIRLNSREDLTRFLEDFCS